MLQQWAHGKGAARRFHIAAYAILRFAPSPLPLRRPRQSRRHVQSQCQRPRTGARKPGRGSKRAFRDMTEPLALSRALSLAPVGSAPRCQRKPASDRQCQGNEAAKGGRLKPGRLASLELGSQTGKRPAEGEGRSGPRMSGTRRVVGRNPAH